MLRKIIKIDEKKCNGCGLCAMACHEGAIGMVNHKASLLRDDYCDGLGDCLPVCPTNAITFEEREAAAFDEAAVKSRMATMQGQSNHQHSSPFAGGCPGQRSHTILHSAQAHTHITSTNTQSRLSQWPIQIKLAPVNAPYFENANLLIAADCAAYAYANFHEDFIKNHLTLIGCPKLDEGDYTEKLTEIIRHNNLKSVMVTRMEVPCCGGIENAVKQALINSGKMIPWQVVTISTDGRII